VEQSVEAWQQLVHQVPAEYITLIWHYAQIPKDEVAEELTLFMQEADTRFSEAVDDAERFTTGTLPNGLAFASNGDILISNFGTDRLERMTRTGESTIMHDSVDGEPIGKVNFVIRDSRDRIYMTVSTMITNWMEAISPNVADGRIVLVDDGGIRIFAITPDGDLRIILDDDRGFAAGRAFLDAFHRDEATSELMLAAGGTIAPWTASVTFGGPDLRTVYVGSLRGSRIPYFRSPVAGLPMVHWQATGAAPGI